MNASCKLIVFFDADCHFCSATARWLAHLDRQHWLSFAPLTGNTARQRNLTHHAHARDGTLVVCRISDDAIFLRAEAALIIADSLRALRPLARALRCLPLSWLNQAYRIIAKNRHRIWQKPTHCTLPSADFSSRLLD